MDDNIDRLEKDMSHRSIAETLWGGQRGPGLIYAVAELNKACVSLAESVSKVSTEIHGDEGVKNSIRDLRRDVAELKAFKKIFVPGFWFLIVLGLATLFANGHILFDGLREASK